MRLCEVFPFRPDAFLFLAGGITGAGKSRCGVSDLRTEYSVVVTNYGEVLYLYMTTTGKKDDHYLLYEKHVDRASLTPWSAAEQSRVSSAR